MTLQASPGARSFCVRTPCLDWRSVPAAKAPNPYAAARATTRARATRSTATRRDVERRITRRREASRDAGDALQLLGKDMGRGGRDAYKELTRTARALHRDTQRTNRRMLKDFDKLRAAVTPSATARRSSTRHIAFRRHPHRGRVTPVDQRGELRPRGLDRECNHRLGGLATAALERQRDHTRALCANSKRWAGSLVIDQWRRWGCR